MDQLERERLALQVFGEVCSLPVPERAAMVDVRCGSDALLRLRVATLLGADANPVASLQNDSGVGAFLGTEIRRIGIADPVIDRADERHTRVPSHYRIIGVLGEGGMATVYEAEQVHPRRRVAIKVIRGRLSEDARRRFDYEAQVLAGLQHPGIARLYDSETRRDPGAGQSSVHCYLAMELIRGLPIDEHVERSRLDVPARLKLALGVCDAIGYAHGKGVVHRDLKPANILIDATGQPKVLDFGVARALELDAKAPAESGRAVGDGQLVGTLAYMSPEQVDCRLETIDARCDVYALGVLLYKLLSGAFPIDVADDTVLSAMKRICSEVPAKLGTRDRRLRGDLEAIVAKAMEKDPNLRYRTVQALADDISRHLDGRPIDARSDSSLYVLTKTARRLRGPLALVGAALALLVGFATYTHVENLQTRRLLEKAIAARDADAALPIDAQDLSVFRGAMVTLTYGSSSPRTIVPGVIVSGSGLVIATADIDLPVGAEVDVTTADGAQHIGRIVRRADRVHASDPTFTLVQLPERETPWPAVSTRRGSP